MIQIPCCGKIRKLTKNKLKVVSKLKLESSSQPKNEVKKIPGPSSRGWVKVVKRGSRGLKEEKERNKMRKILMKLSGIMS